MKFGKDRMTIAELLATTKRPSALEHGGIGIPGRGRYVATSDGPQRLTAICIYGGTVFIYTGTGGVAPGYWTVNEGLEGMTYKRQKDAEPESIEGGWDNVYRACPKSTLR